MTDLMTAARQYARARVDIDTARVALREAIRAAAEAGMPETQIARESGITRVTVRRDLGKR